MKYQQVPKGQEVVTESVFKVTTADFSLCVLASIPSQLLAGAPFVLIPNSGLVHHVGTCRSSVELARFLASHGILVCRVDLPNLGDSGPRFDRLQMDEAARTVQELTAVIDQVQTMFSVDQVVVYGLCSGSQNGFKVAVQDSRVIGLFGVDHFGFQNWSYRLVHYARQALRLKPWLNRLKKLLKLDVKQSMQVEAVDLGGGDFVWQYPPKEVIEEGYRALVARGVKMHYVYTGDWSGEYNHRRQFFLMHSSVDFKGLVRVDYCPKMSHILAEPNSQIFIRQQLYNFLLAKE